MIESKILKIEALEILEQLQICCAKFESDNKKNKGTGKEIQADNINLTPFLKKKGNLAFIEHFLQNKGLNFSTSSNPVKRPFTSIDGSIISDKVDGVIKGESIEIIKTKIQEVIHKLSSKDLTQTSISTPVVDKNSDTITTIVENGIGYLIFYGEKIEVGEVKTGKFKLIETLCSNGLGKAKTIDVVFDYIKVKKDKNKFDSSLDSPYLAINRKLSLIAGQMREVNRAISIYAKEKGLKKLKFRLKIKVDRKNNTIWIENKVGRRG